MVLFTWGQKVRIKTLGNERKVKNLTTQNQIELDMLKSLKNTTKKGKIYFKNSLKFWYPPKHNQEAVAGTKYLYWNRYKKLRSEGSYYIPVWGPQVIIGHLGSLAPL